MSPVEPSPVAASPRRRLRTDVLLMAGANVVALVLGIATSVLLARGLGPSDRGLVAAAYAMTLVLVQIGVLGFTTANAYVVARDRGSTGRVVVNSLWVAAFIGTVLAAGGLLLHALAPDVIEGVGTTEALVAFGAVPIVLAAMFLQSVLLGEGRTVAYNAVDITTGIFGAAALAVAILVLDIGVLGVLAVVGLQYLVAAIAYAVLLWGHVGRRLLPDTRLLRSMLGYSFRLYVAQLLAYLVIRIDMLMVNGILGSAEAGRYAVTVALADGLAVIPTAVAVNLMPRVAEGGSTADSARVFRSVALIYAVICLATVPFASLAVGVLYGEAFSDAVGLYYWLLPGTYALGMLSILAHHFAGRGFPLEAMLVWFAGVAVNVLINVLFLADGGTKVAALSSSIAYLLLLALHTRMFAREAGGYRHLLPRLGETVSFVRVALSRTPT